MKAITLSNKTYLPTGNHPKAALMVISTGNKKSEIDFRNKFNSKMERILA